MFLHKLLFCHATTGHSGDWSVARGRVIGSGTTYGNNGPTFATITGTGDHAVVVAISGPPALVKAADQL